MNTTSKVVIITALASLAIALSLQHQDVAAFNDKNNNFIANTHSHTSCETGLCEGNDGFITNSATAHSNENFNSNRDPMQKSNSFIKPGNENPGP